MTLLNRRQLLKWLAAAGLGPVTSSGADRPALRIGITPVFQTERTSLLREWRDYLEHHLRQPVRFEQSNTYRDIVNNLLAQRLDFAWICGFPYVVNRSRLTLTAVPLYQGEPIYHSYLIVPARDTTTRSIIDLREQVFAYADPDSNSGFLVPRYNLHRQGVDPDTHFRKTFFTSGHRNAIEAVSLGLADGAHVDGYIWDTMNRFSPEITRRTRVVSRSKPYGFPPIVAGPSLTPAENLHMQKILIAMNDDPAAAQLLNALNLDGFTKGDPIAYLEIAGMAKKLVESKHVP